MRSAQHRVHVVMGGNVGRIKQDRYIEAGQHPSEALGGWNSPVLPLLQKIMSGSGGNQEL